MKHFAVSENRIAKARKIDAVLSDFLGVEGVEGKEILDIGCGSGHIAEYFARRNEVVAADVVDQRSTGAGACRFQVLEGLPLPFADGSFDVVILNHVICCIPEQLRQLTEIRRVLKEDGVCYFASANRNFPVEGFTKLPLLHYLPRPLFTALYKALRKTGDELYLLGHGEMVRLAAGAGFACREYTAEIMRNPAKYHNDGPAVKLPVPQWLSPTAIFILSK